MGKLKKEENREKKKTLNVRQDKGCMTKLATWCNIKSYKQGQSNCLEFMLIHSFTRWPLRNTSTDYCNSITGNPPARARLLGTTRILSHSSGLTVLSANASHRLCKAIGLMFGADPGKHPETFSTRNDSVTLTRAILRQSKLLRQI